jgi:hypothetical protein
VIEELEGEGLRAEALVAAVARELAISPSEARFLIAIERGESDGDVIVVDDSGPAK